MHQQKKINMDAALHNKTNGSEDKQMIEIDIQLRGNNVA